MRNCSLEISHCFLLCKFLNSSSVFCGCSLTHAATASCSVTTPISTSRNLKGRGSYTSCISAKHGMNFALIKSSAIQQFEHSEVLKIRDRIIWFLFRTASYVSFSHLPRDRARRPSAATVGWTRTIRFTRKLATANPLLLPAATLSGRENSGWSPKKKKKRKTVNSSK